nr:MAG TPA: hypothetical protein [Caudoviricetes sp.]
MCKVENVGFVLKYVINKRVTDVCRNRVGEGCQKRNVTFALH